MTLRTRVIETLIRDLCGAGDGAWRCRHTGKLDGTVTIESPSGLVRWRVHPRHVRKERAWRDDSGAKRWRIVKRLSLSDAVAIIDRMEAKHASPDGSSTGPIPAARERSEGVLAAHRRQREERAARA